MSREPESSVPTVLDVARKPFQEPITTQLRAATDLSGMTIGGMVRAVARLGFGPGRITFPDYIKLRLFDPAVALKGDLNTFVGQRRNRDLCVDLNFRHDWLGLMTNKIASTSYLAAYGLPTIATQAIYAPQIESFAANVLRDRSELRSFLGRREIYPLFGKPIESFQSLGSIGLSGIDPGGLHLRRLDGSVVDLDRLLGEIETHYAAGYLFQPMVLPHPQIGAMSGGRLATARIITMVTEDGPQVFRACWKIPAGTNVADNYWRPGNLLAQVDPASGQILRVTSGTGLSTLVHDTHPDTGVDLTGFRYPDWDQIRTVALAGARVMRHVPLIGWDIASTAEGIVIVEMNETPDFFLAQFAERRGVLDQDLKAFIAFQRRQAFDFRRRRKAMVAKL